MAMPRALAAKLAPFVDRGELSLEAAIIDRDDDDFDAWRDPRDPTLIIRVKRKMTYSVARSGPAKDIENSYERLRLHSFLGILDLSV